MFSVFAFLLIRLYSTSAYTLYIQVYKYVFYFCVTCKKKKYYIIVINGDDNLSYHNLCSILLTFVVNKIQFNLMERCLLLCMFSVLQ